MSSMAICVFYSNSDEVLIQLDSRIRPGAGHSGPPTGAPHHHAHRRVRGHRRNRRAAGPGLQPAEGEGIEETGGLLAQACAARVVSVEPIPGSHNVKASVQTGLYGDKVVVCGAPNCRPGMFSAYVPIGKKVVNGVESDGMLASGAELGLNRDAAGIIELAGPIGAPLACCADSIVEIDNKSITHRPDLWGHFGMAREVAAILRHPLRD